MSKIKRYRFKPNQVNKMLLVKQLWDSRYVRMELSPLQYQLATPTAYIREYTQYFRAKVINYYYYHSILSPVKSSKLKGLSDRFELRKFGCLRETVRFDANKSLTYYKWRCAFTRLEEY